MMKKNQSDGLTEADCSRQMGQYKRPIFRRMVLYLHEEWRRYRLPDAECNFLVEVFGYIRSEDSEMHTKNVYLKLFILGMLGGYQVCR